MKNLSIINATHLTKFALMPLPGIKNAFEGVLGFIRGIADIDGILILAGSESVLDDYPVPDDIRIVRRDDWNVENFIATLEEESSEAENTCYLHGDTPLLDPELYTKMSSNHKRYFSQYTFADGYPLGLSIEIARNDGLQLMRKLSEGDSGTVKRETLFSVIQKDINAFDLETEISPEDLRLLRVSLTADTKRNYQLLTEVMSAGGRDETTVLKILMERADLLRTLPAYCGVQIIDGCPQTCSYCPFPGMGGDILTQRNEMGLDSFREILKKVKAFSDDSVIGLSLWGEPSLHSEIAAFAEAVCSIPGFEALIETSGIGWKEEVLSEIEKNTDGKVTWIVSLDALDPALYQKLRGNGFEESYKLADKLLTMFGDRAHVQAVRMKQNEENLEAFFRHWKEKTENVIVQKYDSFAGHLPDKKVTDLSPLKRFPCWHLKRDLTILLDGSVPVCGEDVKNTHIIGNIFSEPIDQIWEKIGEWYAKHVDGQYPELCKECDEYYTYNF